MTAEDIKAYCLSKHKACEAYPWESAGLLQTE